jgi:hypothetical protein
MANAIHDGVSVSRLQIDDELHAAERALEAATERRHAAEQALWQAVSSSGKSGKMWRRKERVDIARSELAEAEQALADAEALAVDLRKQLQYAQEREERLMAVTDMLLAREDARRADESHGKVNGHPPKAGLRRSLLDRFRRH